MGHTRLARRILVIEDDRSVRELFVDFLGGEGHEVRAAPDGLEGLAIADAFRPHLIFLDLRLDGHAFLRRYRAEERNDAAIVAMVTSVMAPPILPGADGVLSKPFTLDELLLALATKRPGRDGPE